MRTRKEMRRLADALIDPIRVPVPAEPEVLFQALVASVGAWRGREVRVHRAAFPPHTASGLWLERDNHDYVVVDERAAVWHQIVIFCHEVWHMNRRQTTSPSASDGSVQSVAARTDFSLAEEQEADRFGMLMGRRLRTWLEASTDSVFAAEGGGSGEPQDLAGRIGAALNHRGTRR
ncbi:toxin [Streptomyces sp. M2CJ-2]|uniref:toxin n=1 Tax=Streptomyces sp. M2CJ-2 TaxID=2803948 RepID=UPI0019295DAA|nr:toxin [Streptomyces sp. M2CJ-2]MBL3669966.1 toxin [Streptomyces sp. M2CJ-2]